MPKFTIPSPIEKTLRKPARGEIFGELWATKNIDLVKNRGKMVLSERIFRVFDDTDDADMEIPVAFVRTDADGTDRWWALCQNSAGSTSDGLMFKSTNTSPISAWAQDAIASSPTDAVDDMEIFGQANGTDRLVVARDTDLTLLNNGAWTAAWWTSTLGQSALVNTSPVILHQFINKLMVANGNVLHTIDDSLVVVASRIVLPKEYRITWMRDDGTFIHIGTEHIRGGEARVFWWNGTSETYNGNAGIFDRITYAGVDKNGIMTTINGKGQLLGFNGDAFQELDHLPVKNASYRWEDSRDTPHDRLVHHNGMEIVDGNIHILINGAIEGLNAVVLENMPSGVYEYDPDIGLYAKYLLSSFDGSTDDDWGSAAVPFVGALRETTVESGRFLAGGGVWTDNFTTIREAIFATKVDLTVTQRGYIITSQLQGTGVQNFWSRMKVIVNKMYNSTDLIVVKYKVTKTQNFDTYNKADDSLDNFRFAITWTDGDTFTSGNNLSGVSVGDEVEVILGSGAGATAHISSISEAGGTYTVNLDESIPGAASTETAQIRVSNWIKLGTLSDQTIESKLFSIIKRSKWISLKVELRGTDVSPELQELTQEFTPHKR